MARPFRPAHFTLEVGKRWLKGRRALTDDEQRGFTSEDKEVAENNAWELVLSAFIHHFDVSDWETSPPGLVFQIWDLLASAQFLWFANTRLNIESAAISSDPERWITRANDLTRRVLSPKSRGERLSLVGVDGAIFHARKKRAIPLVGGSDYEFFPDASEYAGGETTFYSAEEIFDNLRASNPGA